MPSFPRLAWLVVAVGCGGGGGRTVAPVEHLGPDEVPSTDGLVVVETAVEQIMECVRHDLAVRVVSAGQVRDEVLLPGTCTGACTPEEKAEGEATVAEIEARIAAGEGSESELDYNFTQCMFLGAELGRLEQAAGRELAILIGEEAGPHDIPHRRYQLAAEVCGAVFLGSTFGGTYANHWSLEDLKVATAGADTIVITVDDDGAPRELYRVRFGPECAEPEEVVGDAGGY
jgi:hypothetical protein